MDMTSETSLIVNHSGPSWRTVSKFALSMTSPLIRWPRPQVFPVYTPITQAAITDGRLAKLLRARSRWGLVRLLLARFKLRIRTFVNRILLAVAARSLVIDQRGW
jgi:hypothetical protein